MSKPPDEVVEKFQKEAEENYDRFFSDLESSKQEDLFVLADAMYKAGQNRALIEGDRSVGVNTVGTNRANTGSMLYWRLVNQFAGELGNLILGAEEPFRYSTVVNWDIPDSMQEGQRQASQRQTLAKWIMKQDNFPVKWSEFCVTVGKYTSIPVRLSMKKVKTRVFDMSTRKWGEKFSAKYPSFEVLHPMMVFGDYYAGKDQSTVIVASKRSRHEIAGDVAAGTFDKGAWKKVLAGTKDGEGNAKAYHYDGSTLAEFREDQADDDKRVHEGNEQENMYLQWDVYSFSPIVGDGKKAEWKPGEDERLYLGTFLGNTLSANDSVCMRIDTDIDPNGEIPVRWIHAHPDDTDLLYHVSTAQILRSNYSTLCTLTEFTLDNINAIVNAPKGLVQGALVNPSQDLSSRAGNTLLFEEGTNINDVLKPIPPQDTTAQTTALLSFFTEDARTAFNQSKNDQGQSFGARTGSTEVANIARSSSVPTVFDLRYIVMQFFPWYADWIQKAQAAWGDEEVFASVTDDTRVDPIRIKDLSMDFDVVIDVVDEFEASVLEAQKLTGFLQLLASSPQLIASATHTVNMKELLTSIAKKMKLRGVGKFIGGPQGEDPKMFARAEEEFMKDGADVPVLPNQDHAGHLITHDATELEYRGVPADSPDRIWVDTLLVPHIARHRGQMQQGTGNAPAPTQNQTEGEAQGNQLAAANGAAVPQ